MSGHLRQRSAGSWEVRYRVNGAARTTTVKGTKTQAKVRLRELMGAVDRGEHVAGSAVTVGEHVRSRIESWQRAGRIGARTAENYQQLARRIERQLGSIRLQRLDTVQIEAWHAELVAEGLGPRTVRALHALLTRALADGVKHRVLVRNVAREQGSPLLAPPATVTTPHADAVEVLLVALGEGPWRGPVVVALYTGLRRGEQLALRWSNVDLDGARLRVDEALEETRSGLRVKPPKTAAGRRTISLPAIVVDTLREHRQAQLERRVLLGLGKPPDDALVFPDDHDGYQSPHGFSMRWARVVAGLGMSEITWHSLRHAHASMLIGAKVSITVVAARLGHADPSVTLKVYSHLFEKDDSAAAAAIDQALGG